MVVTIYISVPPIIMDRARVAQAILRGLDGGVKFLAKNAKKQCFFDIFFFRNLNFSGRRGGRLGNFYPTR